MQVVQIINKFVHWNVNLCVGNTPIQPSFATFYIQEPSRLKISAHIGLKHRGNYPTGVGYGIRFGIRGPFSTEQATAVSVGVDTNAPSWIRGAKTADNIVPLEQHYACPALHAVTDNLQPGWYRVEMWGNCHGSTAGPVLTKNDSVVEINGEGGSTDPYNSIIYEILQ